MGCSAADILAGKGFRDFLGWEVEVLWEKTSASHPSGIMDDLMRPKRRQGFRGEALKGGREVGGVVSEIGCVYQFLHTLGARRSWYPLRGRNGWLIRIPLSYLILHEDRGRGGSSIRGVCRSYRKGRSGIRGR